MSYHVVIGEHPDGTCDVIERLWQPEGEVICIDGPMPRELAEVTAHRYVVQAARARDAQLEQQQPPVLPPEAEGNEQA